ncbi:MAG: gliding motility-associated-like protein [Salibacteraceae bacterium]|jgi:gliding motility-associated-like protein
MKIILSIAFGLITLLSIGQNTNNIWYFGDGNFLDFNANMATPVLSANGVEVATPTSTYCQEGSSTVCDAAGNLLFYNNSENVWDRFYNPMPNGTNLTGSAVTSAQTMIVPKPGSPSIYYIFHMDYAAGTPNLGLFYSEVDMTLNGGLGDVTANKNIALGSGPCSEQLKAVTHCNGQDIWLISHSLLGNTFNCYLITSAGITAAPVASSIGNPHPDAFSGMSYMTCSKDGSKIALAGNMGSQSSVEVFSFDNLNGTFCNPQYLVTPDFVGIYGVEFSSDGTKLYATGFQLHQYDFGTTNWYTFPPSEIGGALMRGPNDKIYLVTGCDWYDVQNATMEYARDIHVIQNPNNIGAAANLQLNAYLTPRECGLGLPTCYYPTQTTNTCNPMLAEFTVNNQQICEGDCAMFSNTSVGASIVSSVWTFPGGTPSNFTGSVPPVVCYNTTGVYTANLLTTDCAGLTSSYDMVIDVINCSGPQPIFQAAQTQFCVNNCTNFSDLSMGTNLNAWSWTFAGGNPSTSTDQSPQNICYNAPGVYDVTLEVTDDNGTSSSTVVGYITVDACIPPISLIAAPDTVCVGSCINLMDQSSNSPTSWAWILNGGNPTISSDQNPQNVCFLTTGTYTLELTTSNSYGVDATTKDIVVIDMPNAGTDAAISWCVSNEAQNLELFLSPGVPLNGTWTNQNGTLAFTGSTFTPQLATPGAYTIIYTLSNAICTDAMEFTIDIQAMPNAGLDGTLLICDNDSPLDLVASVLFGNPDLNGSWSPVLNSGTSIFDPSIDPSGVYNYIVPPNLACGADSSLATLTITYISNVEIIPVDALCITTDPLVLETNINGGTWAGSGMQNNTGATFNPNLAGPGVHTLLYTIDVDNCVASSSIDIEVFDVPLVDLGDDLSHCIADPLSISINTSEGDEILWSDGSTGYFTNLVFDDNAPGEYVTVNVEVSNSCGQSTDYITISLIDCAVYVYIPNVFTPDGDEYNNVFTPVISGENINEYSMIVYNRWGETIFESNDISLGWDGQYNGNPAQSGVYQWTVRLKSTSHNATVQALDYVGHVNLLR